MTYFDAKNERRESVQYIFVLLALLVLDIFAFSLFKAKYVSISLLSKNIWGFHATRIESMKRHLYKSSDFICGRKKSNLQSEDVRVSLEVLGVLL